MKPDYDVERLDDLIRLLLDEALPEKERAELGELLRGSRQARDHYRTSLRIHAALIRHPRTGVVEERRGVISWKRWISGGIAACLCLGLWLAWAGKEPEAWLSGERGAVWSREVERDVAGRTMELRYGFAEVSFRNGVKVTLEGPCRFEVVDVSRMKVMSGKVSVKAPEKKPAGFAFHLDTPGGRLTDLGTEFGVSVGSGAEGAVVLTEVFDGEIEVPGSDGARKRMRAGDAAAIVKESGGTKLVTEPDDGPVDLGNVARKLPENVMRTDFPGNLALGKPVTTPAYLNKARGSVFPPDNLTDGRLNDTGTPGDWSFWLAPDGQSGQFTVDLLEPVTVGRIVMQNTRNRNNGDRGLKAFAVLVSEDNETFREVFRGEMKRVEELPPPGTDFPFETFSFGPVKARYVKIAGLGHYRSEMRKPGHGHYDFHGGGLNEILIFGK